MSEPPEATDEQDFLDRVGAAPRRVWITVAQMDEARSKCQDSANADPMVLETWDPAFTRAINDILDRD